MSKHQKEVRRERKKTDRARRLMARFREATDGVPHKGALALAAAAVIAAGTQAYADPVRFDNPAHGDPGHFHWPAADDQNALDLAADASSQPGVLNGPTSLLHIVMPPNGMVNGSASVEVNATDYLDLLPLNAGELVGPALSWWTVGYSYYAGYGSYLPEGTPTYLGARINGSETWNYAWIGVVRTGPEMEAFAWGYETEVGVAIPAGAVPEPGTLALLAFGAAAVAGRRRRA